MRKQHGTVPIEVSCVNPQVDSTLQPPCTELEGNSAEPAGVNIPSTSGEEGTRWASRQIMQPRIDNYTISKRPIPISKSKQLDEQIVKFIVKGYHSFAIVEEEEFRNMYKMILPTYTLPTRKTISSSLVARLYQSTKEKVMQMIAEADAICLTTDGWT